MLSGSTSTHGAWSCALHDFFFQAVSFLPHCPKYTSFTSFQQDHPRRNDDVIAIFKDGGHTVANAASDLAMALVLESQNLFTHQIWMKFLNPRLYITASCLYKKLSRRWDSERELSLRRHCTRTRKIKYNRLVHKFRHKSFSATQVYQIQWNNAM